MCICVAEQQMRKCTLKQMNEEENNSTPQYNNSDSELVNSDTSADAEAISLILKTCQTIRDKLARPDDTDRSLPFPYKTVDYLINELNQIPFIEEEDGSPCQTITFCKELITYLYAEKSFLEHREIIKICFGDDIGNQRMAIKHMGWLYLTRKNGYSTENDKVLIKDVELSTRADFYFDLFKGINEDTVDMDFVQHIDRTGISVQALRNPGFVANQARLFVVQEAIKELLAENKDLLTELFKLILFDDTVSKDDESFDYQIVVDSLFKIARDDELYWHFLREHIVVLLNNDALGSHASKSFALDEMSLREDRDIVPILKRFYDDTSHPFNFEARLKLYKAVNDFPDCFSEKKFDRIKKIAGDTSFILSV